MAPSTAVVRRCSSADVSLVASTIIESLLLDPQYPYRYYRLHQYPEDMQNWSEVFVRNHLKMPNCDCIVAELPSLADPRKFTVASFAVWQVEVDGAEPQNKEDLQLETVLPDRRRHVSEVRNKAFWDNLDKATAEYFTAEKYGPRKLSLECMVTSPAYFRRGAGKALMEWGLQRAREIGAIATLFASPMGKMLYLSVGFKEIADVVTQVEGEDESVSVLAMVWVGP